MPSGTPFDARLARAAAVALVACASLATFGTLAAFGAPDDPRAAEGFRWTPEAVVDTTVVGNARLAPDGLRIVFTRSRWRGTDAKPGAAWSNLWSVPFDGGEPRPLTSADAAESRPRFSPDGTRLAFLAKRGGEDAKTRIWILPWAGGESAALTDEKTDVVSFEWAPSGKAIAFLAVDRKTDDEEKDEKAGRDHRVVDANLKPRRLWIADPDSGQATRLAALGELSAWDYDWAPDSSALVATVSDLNRTDESYIGKRVVVLPRSGAARVLAPRVGKLGEVAWSPDGRWIAWRGGVDGSDPFQGSVFVAPAKGGAARNLTGERRESAAGVQWHPDGRLLVTTNAGTRTALWSVDVRTGAWAPLLHAGEIVFSAPVWSRDGARYALIGSARDHPADLFAGTLAAVGDSRRGPTLASRPRRIVNSHGALADLPRARQETISYNASDGLDIEAVLLRPAGRGAPARLPLVVIVHGGPESQYQDGWINGYGTPAQALAERGCLVLLPNYRGSTGRGVAFAKADHRDLGGREFEDVLDGIDTLIDRGWVDAQRVGMLGGSYGGYFTGLAVTKHSERFAAGVTFFGIASWESFLGQTDTPIENAQVHWDLSCYEHPALCRAASPLGHVDKARTPTLILQGDRDRRVPKPQSDELYAALRWKGVPVEYVTYPREEHGFDEREHRLDALRRLLGWFERHLSGAR